MGLFSVKPVSRILEEAGAGGENELRRTLGPAALVALGIGAIIGSGIFSLTGVAAAPEPGRRWCCRWWWPPSDAFLRAVL